MIVKNANIYTKDHIFQKGNIILKDGLIQNIELEDDESIKEISFEDLGSKEDVLDVNGKYVIPALMDIHFHGALGSDFCDGTKESLDAISMYECKNGVLEICPATMTVPEDQIEKILSNAANYKEQEKGSSLVGINLEGPFISPLKMGAQNPENIKNASLELFEKWQALSKGLIRLLDIAPEEANNMKVIKDIKEKNKNIHISIAHSNCNYDEAKECFKNGADHLTHLWNAMNMMQHRNPGPAVAGMEEGAFAELICDGIHIHPAMVRLAFKMFGDDKIVLISDSIRASGMPDGEYDLGGQNVLVRGRKAVLKDNENALAGSVTNLFECMKNCVSFGIPLETAIRASSENPAKSIGLFNEYGSIEKGKIANLLVLNDNLELEQVIKKGKII